MKWMVRKKLSVICLVLIMLVVLVSCKVSKDYQGEWFALDGLGNQVKLNFTEKELKTSDGKSYSLSQYGIGVENRMQYFQIKIDDEKYSFIYPDKKDKDIALVVKPDDEEEPLKGKILFKMNRNDYPEQD